ncbi:hypothetical protein RB195_005463 [Necator americanus]|uniref:Frizzled/Smoothened transmembrane domain-containing protein n=1 Tax=Necator americanus TaxID=51031 RepID=A0ABR1BS00_NECAM
MTSYLIFLACIIRSSMATSDASVQSGSRQQQLCKWNGLTTRTVSVLCGLFCTFWVLSSFFALSVKVE